MFDIVIRPLLVSALLALITIAGGTLLATTPEQVWILVAAIVVAGVPAIVESTLERDSGFEPMRGDDYLPTFEFLVRPALLMVPVLALSWIVRAGVATSIGLHRHEAGLVVGLGMAAIAFSISSRRYRSAW